jgi:hypothetical protein
VPKSKPAKKSARRAPRYRLTSGEAMHRKHPQTFELPTRAERESLPVGSFAKLIFAGRPSERMWVKVTGKRGGRYTGVLDNAPVAVSGVRLGDRISFGPEHVIDTMPAGAARAAGFFGLPMKPRTRALLGLGVLAVAAGGFAWSMRRRAAALPPA